MPESNKFHFDQFADLDNSPDLEYLLQSMDLMAALPCIQHIKNQAINNMNISLGNLVLEAGCGLGIDAERISKIVGNNGQVIALDASSKMLEEAKNRSNATNIDYRVVRIESLEFPDNYFDACHIERVLVDYANAEAIIAELVRVVKPGGSICITDVDALSITITPHNQLTSKILHELHKCFVNTDMGRILPTLLGKQKVENMKIFSNTSTISSFATLDQLFQFDNIINRAIRNGDMSNKETKSWIENVKNADACGQFFYSINLFTVIASKT